MKDILQLMFLLLFLQKPVDTLKFQQTQTEKETSSPADTNEFNNFQFWREPLPPFDIDLLDLLVSRSWVFFKTWNNFLLYNKTLFMTSEDVLLIQKMQK